jgi:hypothetical protein
MSARTRMLSWFRRQRRRRAARTQAPLREFVYLDDVSVYSLIASRLGPVAAEFTDTETASLQSELTGTLGANVGVAKSELKSRLQANQSSASQVLRKSIVQTTFKELYELEESSLALRPTTLDDPAPTVPTLQQLGAWLRDAGHPWAIKPDELKRGQLVELEVELDAEPIFKISTVVSTMLEIMRESPDASDVAGFQQLEQIESVARILEKLLAGLIPIRANVTDYFVVDTGHDEWLVHRDVISKMPASAELTVRSLNLVGVAEEALFWKDIRRILFGGSSYRVMCRLARSGIQDSWTPVKLTDVFKEVLPEVASSLESLNRTTLLMGSGGAADGDTERHRTMLSTALRDYAQALVQHHGHEISREDLLQPGFIDVATSSADEDVKARRQHFRDITSHLENRFGFSTDPVVATHLRTAALLDADLGVASSNTVGSQAISPADPSEEMRFLDAEFIAIYW